MVDEDQHNEITDSKYFKELQNQIRLNCFLKHIYFILRKSVNLGIRKGLIPRALFLGEMRNISPVSFEL